MTVTHTLQGNGGRGTNSRRVEQQVRFCTSTHGVRIAYAVVGSGPLLVRAAMWMTHLEYDWRPSRRRLLDALTSHFTLVRYDERGCGLSDWNVEDISFETMVCDLESVVDALQLEQFALLGMSQGGPVAIAYALRHPGKVSRLVLHGAYARGQAKRGRAEREEHEAQVAMMKLGWDKDNAAYRQVFASLFMPDAPPEAVREWNEWMRLTTSSQNAARIQEAFGEIDVEAMLPKITIPTLVLHSRRDARCPFEEGRRVASLIPNAHFVPLESNNHIPFPGEPARQLMLDSILEFLGVRSVGTGTAQSPARDTPGAVSSPRRPYAGEPTEAPPGKRPGVLAPRERAVAALIAQGKTNREIAARLSITESTAETHVQHILNKLGFNSRAQVAAWAAEHRLHDVSLDR